MSRLDPRSWNSPWDGVCDWSQALRRHGARRPPLPQQVCLRPGGLSCRGSSSGGFPASEFLSPALRPLPWVPRDAGRRHTGFCGTRRTNHPFSVWRHHRLINPDDRAHTACVARHCLRRDARADNGICSGRKSGRCPASDTSSVSAPTLSAMGTLVLPFPVGVPFPVPFFPPFPNHSFSSCMPPPSAFGSGIVAICPTVSVREILADSHVSSTRGPPSKPTSPVRSPAALPSLPQSWNSQA